MLLDADRRRRSPEKPMCFQFVMQSPPSVRSFVRCAYRNRTSCALQDASSISRRPAGTENSHQSRSLSRAQRARTTRCRQICVPSITSSECVCVFLLANERRDAQRDESTQCVCVCVGGRRLAHAAECGRPNDVATLASECVADVCDLHHTIGSKPFAFSGSRRASP